LAADGVLVIAGGQVNRDLADQRQRHREEPIPVAVFGAALDDIAGI
jgi:hypothetical protein